MKPFAKNITLRGSAHVSRGVVCEDASGVSVLRDGLGVIACVADGHGDSHYTRSDRGARFAVTTCLSVLERFAYEGADPSDESAMAQLKRELVSEWVGVCRRDCESNQLGEEEREGVFETGFASRAEELYGTTLLAALATGEYLVILQQGDGCAAVLDQTGEWSRPVPPDPLCMGNITTSLSDDDAGQRMRHVVMPCSSETSPLACVLMTDGIEKAVVAEEGLVDALDLLALACDDEGRSGEPRLRESVDRLSAGTGDDASVAFIGAALLPTEVAERMRARHERFAGADEAREIRAKLVSMSRKHDRLEQLWNAGQHEEAGEYPEVHAVYEGFQSRLRELEGNEHSTADEGVPAVSDADLPCAMSDAAAAKDAMTTEDAFRPYAVDGTLSMASASPRPEPSSLPREAQHEHSAASDGGLRDKRAVIVVVALAVLIVAVALWASGAFTGSDDPVGDGSVTSDTVHVETKRTGRDRGSADEVSTDGTSNRHTVSDGIQDLAKGGSGGEDLPGDPDALVRKDGGGKVVDEDAILPEEAEG